MGKIALLDVSERGRQIGEKLFAVLDPEQKKELTQFIFERDSQSDIDNPIVIIPNLNPREYKEHPLTKIYEGDLYFCLEQRVVCVRNQEVELTAYGMRTATIIPGKPSTTMSVTFVKSSKLSRMCLITLRASTALDTNLIFNDLWQI